MKLTNRFKLPDALVRAVQNDSYSAGDADASVTTLLAPARPVALMRKYGSEVVDDVSNRIWSLLGQAVHTVLERANETGIAERRMSAIVHGWKISGGMDLYENGKLTDYKLLRVRKIIEGVPEDYEAQLNSYAYLLRANGHEVNELELVVILRDWDRTSAEKDPVGYPQAEAIQMPVRLWPKERAEQFVHERVRIHQLAKEAVEKEQLDLLPKCTPEERWARDQNWAVMRYSKDKNKKRRAEKLHDNEGSALAHAAQEKDFYVEFRPGRSIRCEAYCGVKNHCEQWKQINKGTI